MPSQSGAGLSLPGVASDGADGLAVTGGLALEGTTPDPNRPIQFDPNAYLDENDYAWHFPSVAVGSPFVHAGDPTLLNVGNVFEVVTGGQYLVRFYNMQSLDGSFGFDNGVVFVAALQGTSVQANTLVLVPTVASGAPSTGAHTKGEMIMDSAGALFVCQVSGTPGTWATVTLT